MEKLDNILLEGAQALNLNITQQEIDSFIKYKDMLLEWNKKMNLTAIEEEKEIAIKHFLDSISCITVLELAKAERVIDVGTGAGFPGIPIKIMVSNIDLTLLDALNKRIGFLKEVCSSLNLSNVNFIHGRAEDFGRLQEHREKYCIAVSRAVASLNVLVEYCIPFIKVGGHFICQKGPQLDEELVTAKKAIEILGCKIVEIKTIKLPFSEINHKILILEKVKQTPTKYPRKAGKPSNNPIV